jgi:hypothetical protein
MADDAGTRDVGRADFGVLCIQPRLRLFRRVSLSHDPPFVLCLTLFLALAGQLLPNLGARLLAI